MLHYIFKRILWLIPVVIGVSLLIFVFMDMAEGDAVSMMTADSGMTAEQVAEIRHSQGYDRSVFYRYGKYMLNLLRGDLGTSYMTKQPVMKTYLALLPATIKLALVATVVTIFFAIPLGIYSAVHAGSFGDNVSMVFALLGLSMPNFWLGLLLIISFSLHMGWFPSSGVLDGWRSYVLPAITLGTGHMASVARVTRSAMLDVLKSDYLRTARSKGASERMVIYKHALRNALIPIVTILGTQLGAMLGGSVLTETVFAWPGVGRQIIEAVNMRDTTMATGFIIMTTILLSIVLLLVDLLYAAIDPRIKSQFSNKVRFGFKKGGNRNG